MIESWPEAEPGKSKDTESASYARLLGEERRRKILELLNSSGRVLVNDLSERFRVSAVTIRGDLEFLAAQGSLVRSHGGAVSCVDSVPDYPLKLKERLHKPEKQRIGAAAARLIESNQTVILDSGTTTAEVARSIRASDLGALTVITHALNIAGLLAEMQNVNLVMLGGVLRHVSYSFVGPQTEQMLKELHAHHVFLGVDGFDIDFGPSTPDILEAQLNSRMIRAARQVTLLADSSKFGRRSLSSICPTSQIHRVITDSGVQAETVAELENRGIEVLAV